MKIDFVLPWVDGNDPIWQKEETHYFSQKTGTEGSFRYRNMGTLKYVLRSIEKNCPWYNKIHLITCGHFPEWLDINHPKINLVTHEELYFDKTHLPVFSSSSIEMNLPNLREVSEQFIYLNDDTIIFNTVGIERFFQYGKPIDFLSHGWLPRNKLFAKLRGMDTWVHSLNNNLRLINKKFAPLKFEKKYLYHPTYDIKNKFSNFLLQNLYKKFIWIEHWHHPQAYLKSSLKEVYTEFKQEMMVCSANKFRSNNDLTQYIYRYWQLATGDYIPYKFNDAMAINIDSKYHLIKLIEMVKKNKTYKFVCLNDSPKLSDYEFEKVKKITNEFLNEKFSDKAAFEL
jgi:hypothetical protein